MDEDTELVMCARDGDTAAYERLVSKHAQVAFRVACVLSGSAADAEEVPLAAATPSTEAAVLVAERDATLRAALAALSPRDREVVYLRYFLDLGEAEMAAALDCRPGTVKSRLSRALERLRAALEEQDG